ncbi:exoribonuclease II [Escherichia coli]|uniref:Exoribonuclease II n=1 Tax=Escherichia coli TaxID=562 RepID=A0A2X1IWW9_ECOLX|nr:exoribonuclease II [Escherichia coli]
MTLSADGTIEDNIEFFAATIESKAKLVYDQVSDWLENTGDWQPESEAIAEQVRLLAQICQRRGEWRHNHALVFKDRPDYRFILGEKGEVLDIVAEPRRIANRIVEEAMIAANICAAAYCAISSVLASITCIWALIRRMPTRWQRC